MRKQFALLLLVLFGVGCGKHPRYDAPLAVELIYDESVDTDHREWTDLDLRTLSWVTPENVDGMGLFALSEVSSTTLSGWLRTRARYIVGESWEYKQKYLAERENFTYTPELYAAVTLMSNFGTSLYRQGKRNDEIIKITVGEESALVTSPRIGLFMIGPGHFATDVVGQTGDVEDLKNSIQRLATLFHEARHGDGNGAHVGFGHKTCDSGTYAGEYACDDSTNGPYTVGKLILKSLRNGCDECNEEAFAEIDASIVDYAERVLPGATEKDDRAERISP